MWDFDGTLFDTYPTITRAFKLALEEEGVTASYDEIMSLVKISESTAVDYYRKEFGISGDFKSKYDKHRKALEPEHVKPFRNVEDVCRGIFNAGKKNYLYTHRGSSSIDFLKQNNLYDYFADFITKENNFKRKPDPEALLYLIAKHNIVPEEAVMVGDRDIDLLAAKNAGIKACLFDFDNTVQCEFADFRISDMTELCSIII
jgi:haloacid dehalogenase superfamily, subfamily IA, variant 3 with third motif having DD or ED/haloacid dehalogenase superfamily, subfamily IA, variant 1 with third motif having Dx(3-4)D or Dx(3-4)E